ncbi:hypothetical protein SAMN05444411_1253 [Lutibacter oricola]|uniref:Lipoprotein n=1 Tax=Lutibacter oricola TaxID=762486 RepID=A0A1H3H3K2_9FLAO|nr:hypothetical protein [Lutibacter oricola]SDY10102.1 hypothetical protein SAMN05444411_1253 [Lutibacter oricola]
MEKLQKYIILILLNILISCSTNKRIKTNYDHQIVDETYSAIGGTIDCKNNKNIFKYDEILIHLDFSVDFCDIFQEELNNNQEVIINITFTKKDIISPSMMFYQIYENGKMIKNKSKDFHSTPFGLDFEKYKNSLEYKIENIKLSIENKNVESEIKDDFNLTLLIK